MKFCATLSFLFFVLQCFSQNLKSYKADSAAIANCPKTVVHLSGISPGSSVAAKELPFENFIIKDVRSDTTSIGVQIKTAAVLSGSVFNKIVFDKPVAQSIETYLNNLAGSQFTSSQSSLVCFIKTLRLAQTDTLRKGAPYRDIYNKMNFAVEAYLDKKQAYYPALRLDTTLLPLTDTTNEFDVLAMALNLLTERASRLDTLKVLMRNAYTLPDLIKKYNQRFDKPILKAKTLTEGIYKTFSEFINNAPSLRDYSLGSYKNAHTLFAKAADGKMAPMMNALGFCDGITIWMNIHNSFHPLIKQGNTFELLGDYNSIDYRADSHYEVALPGANPVMILAGGALLMKNSSVPYAHLKGKIVYQLDMDKGEFY